MIKDGKTAPEADAEEAGRRVGALASRALKVVAAQNDRPMRPHDPQLLAHLLEMILSPARPSAAGILARFGRAGIRAEELADTYIPAAARQLGTDWCADAIGFADVTIGASRLQSLLRDLGPEWRADCGRSDGSGAAILVVVPDCADHTLGANVLVGRLRRHGFSVRLQVGGTPAAVTALSRDSRFDAVFLSASPTESLEFLRRLVDSVRVAGAAPPIVVGGSILGLGDDRASDLLSETGADHATSDLDQALALCRLTTTPRRAEHRASGP